MKKRPIKKDDGRYLIFYEFDKTSANGEKETATEQAKDTTANEQGGQSNV